MKIVVMNNMENCSQSPKNESEKLTSNQFNITNVESDTTQETNTPENQVELKCSNGRVNSCEDLINLNKDSIVAGSKIINNEENCNNSDHMSNQYNMEISERENDFNNITDNQKRTIKDGTVTFPNSYMNNGEISESLSNLLEYNSSDSHSSSSESNVTDDEDTPKDSMNGIKGDTNYRNTTFFSDDTTSSDDSDSDESDLEVGASAVKNVNDKPAQLVKSKGEFTLDDLPPVPDLSNISIDVKEEDCVHMGHIESIVDKLVMVQSLPNIPAYDLDTVLFLDNGKRPLGQVYDVLGPVTCPMYVIRFDSNKDIVSKQIVKNLKVFSAPKTELTHYVFLKQLLKIKGSDASWKEDNEVPPEFADYSDDEAEFNLRVDGNNCGGRKRKSNSLERHKVFESQMNLKNKLDTARHRVIDSLEPSSRRPNPKANQGHRPYSASFNSHHGAAPDPRFHATKPHMPYMRVGDQCAMPPMRFNMIPPPVPPFAVVPSAYAPVPIPPQVYGIPPQPFGGNFPPQFGPHHPPPPPMGNFSTPPPHPAFHAPSLMAPSAVAPKLLNAAELQQTEILNMLKKLPPPPPPSVDNGMLATMPMHLGLSPPPNLAISSNSMMPAGLPKPTHMPPPVPAAQGSPCPRLYPPNLGLPKPNGTVPGATNGPCIPPPMPFSYYSPPWHYDLSATPPALRGRHTYQTPPHGRNVFKKQQP